MITKRAGYEVQVRLLLVLSSCLDFWTIDSTDVCDNAFGEGTHIEILSVYLLNPISLDILKQKAKLWLLYEVMVACWLVFFFACIVNAPTPISCTSLLLCSWISAQQNNGFDKIRRSWHHKRTLHGCGVVTKLSNQQQP